ncbi:DUF397 domain-containing protein [Kitasatospora sp. NPDC086801]|uniref:DUF397 domain-containing protein n=1 Tax=Kitasatospora sp. NPDC086801 TaxID=3364066 RepID=UPI003826EAE7
MATTWRKSPHSGQGGECIEVAEGFANVTPVRDSKDPDGPDLLFPAEDSSEKSQAPPRGFSYPRPHRFAE